MSARDPLDTRVFAMGESGLVAPDFPALTTAEIARVLDLPDERCDGVPGTDATGAGRTDVRGGTAAVGSPGAGPEIGSPSVGPEIGSPRAGPVIEWRSPRPLSSTARVRAGDGTRVIVKRMPSALRNLAALETEHAYMDHLRAHGIPIPRTRAVESGEFTYEIQELGVGEDRYRDEFSWSPYYSAREADAAGAALARLHRAAVGFDAPQRPPGPLRVAVCVDPIGTIEDYCAARPEVGDFLAELDWRRDWEPLTDRSRDLADRIAAVAPLWTHNDWHPTNLLWTGAEVTTVLDFGLSNRTLAVFDLATAIERFAVDWLGTGARRVHTKQLIAFLRGYNEIRSLDAIERDLLPDIFPLVHIAYELSEIDYFLTIPPRREVRAAGIAYRNYLLGRSVWAASSEGNAFTTMLRGLSVDCC
ncbi:phosphotransferase enzyme family protein [Nocardia nova]|uniref:phosphotransferase enzyme family protein n=1 Tax=Nocardia nova TaxID=37330 RepID=UPI0033F36E5E